MGRVKDRAGEVDQVPLVQKLENLLMQPPPDPGSRPDDEPAMNRRLRRPEARRQRPPSATADQHIDDRGEDRLVIDARDPTPLRTYPGRRQQRPRDLPQSVRNNPSPPSTPHAQDNCQLTM